MMRNDRQSNFVNLQVIVYDATIMICNQSTQRVESLQKIGSFIKGDCYIVDYKEALCGTSNLIVLQ